MSVGANQRNRREIIFLSDTKGRKKYNKGRKKYLPSIMKKESILDNALNLKTFSFLLELLGCDKITKNRPIFKKLTLPKRQDFTVSKHPNFLNFMSPYLRLFETLKKCVDLFSKTYFSYLTF